MTHKIEFTPPDIKELKKRLLNQKDAKIYRRLLWLDLKSRGYSQTDISNILGISKAQLTNWSKLFVKEGFEGFCCTHYEDRRPSKLTPHTQRIRQYVVDTAVSTLAALQEWIAQELGIVIEQSWLSRWIKKNSIVLIKKPA